MRRPGEEVQAQVPVYPGKRSSRRKLNTHGGSMIFSQDDESKQQFMVDTGSVCSSLLHRWKTSPTGPQLSGDDGKAIPYWGSVRRRLFARCRLQTHTWFRFLVLPRAAGRPNRPPGAGLEVSETALQTGNCRRVPALQIRNATQTFQRFMDSLFKHLPFVFCYLDDLIIPSHTLEEHHDLLRHIFTILQENGLQINPAKCVFTASAMEFLGHRVDQHGVRLLQRSVQAISDFPPPQDVKQLQQF
jgi:hypothetical protein